MGRNPRVSDEALLELFEQDYNNSEIARHLGMAESSVRYRRGKLGVGPSRGNRSLGSDGPRNTSPSNTHTSPKPQAGDPLLDDLVGPKGGFTLTGNTGEFKEYVSDKPLTDFSDVFRVFNRDPKEFVIVGDVTQRAWQQSALISRQTGERSTVTLYSYSAKFRRRTDMDEMDLPALYKAAHHTIYPYPMQRQERTTCVVWSDPQIGKVASRGGTKELIERSNEKRLALARELEKREPKATVLLDGGDGIEGFESGGNPMFTNDLSLTKQLDLYGTELMEWVKVMLPYGDVQVVAVPSNHAAWRNGKQNLGNPGDDLGLFMHRQVQRVADSAGLPVEFIQSDEHDESVAVNVDGTWVGLVHGNQFGPGQAVSWWEKQTFGSQAVARADVLVTAHYHSFGAGVAGRNPHSKKQRWWLGAPTLDNGSDWYRSRAGRDSDPGVMIFDITPEGFDLSSLMIL